LRANGQYLKGKAQCSESLEHMAPELRRSPDEAYHLSIDETEMRLLKDLERPPFTDQTPP
jgi:hypothetical protein